MPSPLDDLYFEWLCTQIMNTKLKSPSKTYWALLRQLFTKEFVWIVPNDDNRLADGLELRQEFVREAGIRDADQAWWDMGCSVLEMLIALCRRCEFQNDMPVKEWFWKFIDNLGLTKFNDSWYKKEHNEALIDERLNRLIYRTYRYDGSFGGLFPLKEPKADQREIEIWYQMAAYMVQEYF